MLALSPSVTHQVCSVATGAVHKLGPFGHDRHIAAGGGYFHRHLPNAKHVTHLKMLTEKRGGGFLQWKKV